MLNQVHFDSQYFKALAKLGNKDSKKVCMSFKNRFRLSNVWDFLREQTVRQYETLGWIVSEQ